jgi:hypothetical protein
MAGVGGGCKRIQIFTVRDLRISQLLLKIILAFLVHVEVQNFQIMIAANVFVKMGTQSSTG